MYRNGSPVLTASTSTYVIAGGSSGLGINSPTVPGLTLDNWEGGDLTQPITVTGITANNKVYDGTTAATISTTGYVLNGVAAEDAGNVLLATSGYTAAFASADKADNIGVTVSGLTLTGSAANKYTLTQPTGLTASITAATVTPTVTLNNMVYNGTTGPTTINTRSLGGVVSGDDVSLGTSGTVAAFSSKNVNSYTGISITGLSLSGTTAGNYQLSATSTTANASITAATVTPTVTLNNMVYNGTTGPTTINTRSLGGVVSGDDVSLGTSGTVAAFSSKNVNSYTGISITGLSLSGTTAGNYQLSATSTTANASITAATVTPTVTLNNMVYNGTTGPTTINTRSLGGVVSGDDVSLGTSGTVAAFSSKNVNSYTGISITGLSLSGTTAGNYQLSATSTTANASITAATVTPTVTLNNMVYNGTTGPTTINTRSLGGVVSGDDVSLGTSGTVAAFSSKNVNSYTGISITGLSLSGTTAGNYQLSATSTTANASITAATVTPTVTLNNMVYNGMTGPTTINTRSLGGVVSGDDVSLGTSGTVAAFSSKNVNSYTGISITGLSLSGTTAGNYQLSATSTTANASITAATVTPMVTLNNMVYNGMTGPTTINTRSLGGVVSGDDVSLGTSGTVAAFSSKNVNSYTGISITGLSLSGTTAGNYQLSATSTTANASITAATVTPTVTLNNMVYNGTTGPTTINTRSLGGVVSGDDVSLGTSGTVAAFSSKNVNSYTGISITGLSLSGTTAGNYQLSATSTTANASITAATVTPMVTLNNMVYNGMTGPTTINTRSLGGVVSGDDVSLGTSGTVAAFSSKNVNSYTGISITGLSLSGTTAGNYQLSATSTTANASITAATVTPTVTLNNMVYNGMTGPTTINTRSLSGVVGSDDVSLGTSGTVAAFSSKNVNSYTGISITGLSLSGTTAGNYQLSATSTTANASITAATVTPTVTLNNMVYNGTTGPTTINTRSLSGVVGSDDVSLGTSGTVAAFSSKNVNSYTGISITGLSLSGTTAGNYQLSATSTTANASITAATVTPTVTLNNMVYNGMTGPTTINTRSLGGVVSGDDVSLGTSGTVAAFSSKNVNSYTGISITGLSLSGTTAGNYQLSATSTTANASITAATMTPMVTLNNMVYNGMTGPTTINTRSLGGVVSGDDVSLGTSGTVAAFSSKNVNSYTGISITGLSLSGTTAGNYQLSATSTTANASITALGITGSFTAGNKVYDGNNTAVVLTRTLNGVLAGDVGNVSLDGGTATFADAQVGTGKTVTLAGSSLGGAAAGNYLLTSVATTTADIMPLGISVTGITVNDKVYDGGTSATISSNSVVLSGVLAADAGQVELSTNGYVATFASAEVGDNIGVSVSGLSLTGAKSGDYALTAPEGLTAKIAQAAVTITSGITANDKVYDGGTSATISSNSVVLSGVLAADAGQVDLLTNGYVATFASAGAGNTGVSVSGLSLTGAKSGDYLLTPPAGLTADITALGITGNFTAQNKVYDGNSSAVVLTRTLNGVLAGDVGNVSLDGGTATFADAQVGTGKTVTLAGSSLGGAAAGNYLLTSVATTTADITALGITGSFTAGNKVYDGNNTAVVLTRTLNGVLAGDVGNVSLDGGTAAFADAQVGTGKTVTLAGSSLGGAAAGNYLLTSVATTTADITALGITGSFTAGNKVYDGNNTAVVLTRTLNGVLAGDVGNVSLDGGTAAFADAQVGTGKTVTLAGSSLGGAAAGNYLLTSVATTTADIMPLGISVTGITVNDKVYDGGTSATISSNSVVLSGVLAADAGQVELSTNGYVATFASAEVGDNIGVSVSGLSLTGAKSGDYALTAPEGLTAKIAQAAVTITSGITANDKVYDGGTSATISSNSVVLSGVLAADAGQVDLLTNGYVATFASAGAGNTGVSVSGLSLTGAKSGDYLLTPPAGLTADITALGITGNFTAQNKVYDGNSSAVVLTRTLNGVLAGDVGNVSLDGGTATFADAQVGTGKTVTLAGSSLGGAAAGNYLLTSVATTTADITALGITGSFTAGNKVYDGNNTAVVLTRTLNGVLAGDVGNVSLDGGTAAFADAQVGTGKTVTLAGSSLGGAAAGNYLLTSVATTTADITALGITGSFTAGNKVYDGNNTAVVLTRTLNGVLAGDVGNVSLDGGTAAFADAQVGTGKTVTLAGSSLGGAAAGNYLLTSVATTTADIMPLGITGSFTAGNKVYDGNNTAVVLTRGLSGLLAGDVGNVSLTDGTATFADAQVGTGKTVTLAGSTLTGAAAGNYLLTSVATTTANIMPLGITGNFTAQNKVYDGNNTAVVLTRGLSGLLAGDVGNVSLTDGTATFADAQVGTGKTVTLAGSTLTGAAAGNYSLTSVGTTTANITPLGITGSFTAGNKVYDGNNTAVVLTRTLNGVLAGDVGNVSLTDGTAAFADAQVGTGKTVTLTGSTLGGAASGNYSLSWVGITRANITALGITGNFTAQNKVYDGNNTAVVLTRTLNGVLAGDVGQVSLTDGTATFGDAQVGTGKTVTLAGSTLTGTASGNYSLTSVATTTANITPANSATALVSSQNPSWQGSDVTFTATVTPVAPASTTPTGNVQFYTNGVASGSPVTLSGGVASFSATDLPAGTNTCIGRVCGRQQLPRHQQQPGAGGVSDRADAEHGGHPL